MALKKIKEQNKDYDLSILDLLRILDPSKTGKFMNLLLNELKSIPQNEVGEDYENSLGLYLEGMVGVNKILITYLVELLGGAETIRCMGKFLEFSEKKLISKNDIQKYNTVLELCDEVYKTELKLKNRSTQSHHEIILDTEDYLIIKPLNIISSRKYGASTKWCTAGTNTETFYSYSKKGILIYVICRHNNDKWGVYYELNDEELSWWDTKDNRVDGLMVNLPKNVKNTILTYILDEKHPNSYYFNTETKKLSDKPTNEMAIINVNGGNQEVTVNPQPFTGVWRNEINGPKWTPSTTDERIDELVCKTLEYHYTINALKDGGEELS